MTLMAIAKTVTMARDRIVGPGSGGEEEERFNYALRPLKFQQYIGQEPLKIYSLYGPPEHPPGTVHATKAEADAAEHDDE